MMYGVWKSLAITLLRGIWFYLSIVMCLLRLVLLVCHMGALAMG